MKELLKVENLTKIYPNGFVANKDINFAIAEKEIHALVGENGAGKTTLMKILFGMEDYQEGAIYLNGKKLHLKSALDAIAEGIGMIHQHFMLVPSLSIAENIVLGMEPTNGAFFDYKKAVEETAKTAQKYSFDIDVTKKVSDISVGQMQKVEILKALFRGAKILIMDEPTAVLTPQETKELFEQLRRLKEEGHSIIFISHKLEEIMELCDRVTILRKGECLGTYDISKMSKEKISALMIGREIHPDHTHLVSKAGATILNINNLMVIGDDGKRKVDNISFSCRSGIITGIAAVEGSGQAELAKAIAGVGEYHYGSINFLNKEINSISPREIRSLGLAYIPEDRMSEGASINQSISDNIIADRYFNNNFSSKFFIKGKEIKKFVDEMIKEFEIACDDASQPVRMLSGGNIQKVVVAREFSLNPKFIIAEQPTRGIDVGTAEMIRNKLRDIVHEKASSALLISADLSELLDLSDEIIVLHKGKIVAYFKDLEDVNEAILGEYMLGVKEMEVI